MELISQKSWNSLLYSLYRVFMKLENNTYNLFSKYGIGCIVHGPQIGTLKKHLAKKTSAIVSEIFSNKDFLWLLLHLLVLLQWIYYSMMALNINTFTKIVAQIIASINVMLFLLRMNNWYCRKPRIHPKFFVY